MTNEPRAAIENFIAAIPNENKQVDAVVGYIRANKLSDSDKLFLELCFYCWCSDLEIRLFLRSILQNHPNYTNLDKYLLLLMKNINDTLPVMVGQLIRNNDSLVEIEKVKKAFKNFKEDIRKIKNELDINQIQGISVIDHVRNTTTGRHLNKDGGIQDYIGWYLSSEEAHQSGKEIFDNPIIILSLKISQYLCHFVNALTAANKEDRMKDVSEFWKKMA